MKSKKAKFKKFCSEIRAIFKIKPIMFIAMSFSICYGLATTIISIIKLSFVIGFTGSYSLVLGFYKLYALKNYKRIITQNDAVTIKEIERSTVKNITICAAILSFLHLSFTIVTTFFYEERPSNYGLWLIVYMAVVTSVHIVLNFIQSIRTRENHSVIIHLVKLTDSAKTLIAVALLQRAILYFVSEQNASLLSGIGGAFFSLCAGAVCLLMFARYKREAAGLKKIDSTR